MKAVVSLSGGMDSTTVLAEALSQGREVQALAFYYGSTHNEQENASAREIAVHYQVPFKLVDLSGLMKQIQAPGRSCLLDRTIDVPEGHYQEENMKLTVVPGRNTLFLACLLSYAESHALDEIWLGIHSGDHFIYPDCRPEFYEGMGQAIECATIGKVKLVSPFIEGDKTTIIKRGLELGVPYHLTRTCYKSGKISCGKCGSCQERLEAFQNNGIEDPIEYESRDLFEKVQ